MRAATTRPSRARAGGAVLRVAAAPVPAPVRLRLGQGDEELLCARLASRPADRLLHGHLAGLRFASAVVARHGRPAGRPAPRSVWDMLERVEPSLSEWAGFFAAGAPERAAVESGRAREISDERADEVVAAAEDFREVVGALLGVSGDDASGRPDDSGRADGSGALTARAS